MSTLLEATQSGSADYAERRAWIEEYFDRKGADGWARLTSDAPVGRIRQTVRAGRERMRAAMLGRLPTDLRGRRVLDAGCGPGEMAIALAERGAEVVAIDLSANFIALARQRLGDSATGDRICWLTGDMLDSALGEFDHILAMDSLIHYGIDDVLAALAAWAPRVRRSIVFTFAPATPALRVMHRVGRILPGSGRAPAIQPVAEPRLRHRIPTTLGDRLRPVAGERISSGFYTSQWMDLTVPARSMGAA